MKNKLIGIVLFSLLLSFTSLFIYTPASDAQIPGIDLPEIPGEVRGIYLCKSPYGACADIAYAPDVCGPLPYCGNKGPYLDGLEAIIRGGGAAANEVCDLLAKIPSIPDSIPGSKTANTVVPNLLKICNRNETPGKTPPLPIPTAAVAPARCPGYCIAGDTSLCGKGVPAINQNTTCGDGISGSCCISVLPTTRPNTPGATNPPVAPTNPPVVGATNPPAFPTQAAGDTRTLCPQSSTPGSRVQCHGAGNNGCAGGWELDNSYRCESGGFCCREPKTATQPTTAQPTTAAPTTTAEKSDLTLSLKIKNSSGEETLTFKPDETITIEATVKNAGKGPTTKGTQIKIAAYRNQSPIEITNTCRTNPDQCRTTNKALSRNLHPGEEETMTIRLIKPYGAPSVPAQNAYNLTVWADASLAETESNDGNNVVNRKYSVSGGTSSITPPPGGTCNQGQAGRDGLTDGVCSYGYICVVNLRSYVASCQPVTDSTCAMYGKVVATGAAGAYCVAPPAAGPTTAPPAGTNLGVGAPCTNSYLCSSNLCSTSCNPGGIGKVCCTSPAEASCTGPGARPTTDRPCCAGYAERGGLCMLPN